MGVRRMGIVARLNRVAVEAFYRIAERKRFQIDYGIAIVPSRLRPMMGRVWRRSFNKADPNAPYLLAPKASPGMPSASNNANPNAPLCSAPIPTHGLPCLLKTVRPKAPSRLTPNPNREWPWASRRVSKASMFVSTSRLGRARQPERSAAATSDRASGHLERLRICGCLRGMASVRKISAASSRDGI